MTSLVEEAEDRRGDALQQIAFEAVDQRCHELRPDDPNYSPKDCKPKHKAAERNVNNLFSSWVDIIVAEVPRLSSIIAT